MDNTRLKKDNKSILLGVIPARGGSKGLKNKSLREVQGRPLISYTIQDALSYDEIDTVIVTTDSPDIASAARQYGAEVPFMRPKSLAGDRVSMLKVLKHVLTRYEKIFSRKTKGIALFDPTSPLRKEEDIKAMIKIFFKNRPDLVVAVKKSRRNPFFNMIRINSKGYAQLILKGNYFRRQDAPPVYDLTNNFWIFSREAVLKEKRLPQKTIPYEISGPYIDIDREEDLKLFEYILKSGGNQKKRLNRKSPSLCKTVFR